MSSACCGSIRGLGASMSFADTPTERMGSLSDQTACCMAARKLGAVSSNSCRTGRRARRPTNLDGRFHNQPSDLVVDRSGRVWFSDPYSMRPPPGLKVRLPLIDHASVLRLERTPQREWALRRITHDTVAPRAVLLSSDEVTLYVAEGEVGRIGPRELRAYPIGADGTVGTYVPGRGRAYALEYCSHEAPTRALRLRQYNRGSAANNAAEGTDSSLPSQS
jgi:hypothetical protein